MKTESVTGRGLRGFLLRRWHRQVPLATLFWRDMVAVGSLVNVAAGIAGLLMLGLKAGLPASLAVLFAPLPLNALLLAAVWRAADAAPPRQASAYRLGATVWFVVAAVI